MDVQEVRKHLTVLKRLELEQVRESTHQDPVPGPGVPTVSGSPTPTALGVSTVVFVSQPSFLLLRSLFLLKYYHDGVSRLDLADPFPDQGTFIVYDGRINLKIVRV